jgi:predicted ATPase
VLVDNCEHVLDPIAQLIDRMLTRCPNVRVVATSRERLRVPGERVCSVPPLDTQPGGSHAERLFVARAREVAPGFDPDDADLACIARVVRSLDGLPLAIELAAARMHTDDLGEVAAGLVDRFALLSSGHRTSTRHASLGAAVAWSYDLLDPALQQVFSAVSVYAGPFTAADAAAVCGLEVERAQSALAQLTERSLVMRAPGRRYVMLETLRAYGTEQLAAVGATDEVGARHAHHMVEWVEAADRRLMVPGQPVIDEIDAAIPELRAALGWLLDHAEIERAGRLIAALLDYGFLRLRPDVLAWAERVTLADPQDRSPYAPVVWAVSAYAAWLAGDMAELGARSRRAMEVAESLGEPPPEVWTVCGSQALFGGHLEQAAQHYRRGVDAARADPAQRLIAAGAEVLALGYAGDRSAPELAEALVAEVGTDPTPHAAYAWYCAGEAELHADADRAHARFVQALDLADRTSAVFVTGVAGASKASIDAVIGDPVAAAEEYRWLIAHWRRAGVWSTQWTLLRSIAILLGRLGRDRQAAVLAGAVQATSSGHSIFGSDAVALRELGDHLRQALGPEEYAEALAEGARLDGNAAVELALRAL